MPNTGFLGWAYISGSAISFSSGVADQQVLFMSGSDVVSGSSNFKYDYTTDTLTVGPINVSGSIVQGVGSTEIANVFITDILSLQGSGGSYFSGEVLDPFPFPPFPFPVLTGYVYYMDSVGPPAPLTASTTGSGVESFLTIQLGADYSNGALYKGFFNYDVLGTSVKNALLSSSSGTGSLDAFKQIFADPARPGGITTVVPTTSGHVVRCLGHSVGTGSIYFNPSPDFIEI